MTVLIPWALPSCLVFLDICGLAGPAHHVSESFGRAVGSPTASMDPVEHRCGRAAVPSPHPAWSIQLAIAASGRFLVPSRAAGPRSWSHLSCRWHQRQRVPLLDPAPHLPQVPAALEQTLLKNTKLLKAAGP